MAIREVVGVKAALVEVKKEIAIASTKLLNAAKCILLRHIGLLEADEDKIRKIRPKGTLVTILYVPREAICP